MFYNTYQYQIYSSKIYLLLIKTICLNGKFRKYRRSKIESETMEFCSSHGYICHKLKYCCNTALSYKLIKLFIKANVYVVTELFEFVFNNTSQKLFTTANIANSTNVFYVLF